MERKSKVDSMSSDEFKILVQDSPSVMEVLRKLGYKNRSGAMHKKIKDRIKREGLNVEHMTKLNNTNSRHVGNKIPMEEILVENSTYRNTTSLKKRIINEGILEYKCVKCGNTGEWMGKPITLQLDHINGINDDHRLENLRFLCPNCHSQTDTYSGKNQGKYE